LVKLGLEGIVSKRRRKAETFEPVTITCAATAAANAAGRSSLTGKGRGRVRSSRFASRTGRGEKDVRYGGGSSPGLGSF
jgi:hypothetical protein